MASGEQGDRGRRVQDGDAVTRPRRAQRGRFFPLWQATPLAGARHYNHRADGHPASSLLRKWGICSKLVGPEEIFRLKRRSSKAWFLVGYSEISAVNGSKTWSRSRRWRGRETSGI
jgi:hypothetical protein